MRDRIVVVANRLPVTRSPGGWQSSPGGLVSALTPILRRRNGAWIGWTGEPDEEIAPFRHDGMELRPVPLSRRDVDDYYLGFCNETIWPLFHDAIRPSTLERQWWASYRHVNRRFAETVMTALRGGETVWVHDYQLMLVPKLVRDRAPDARIRFFLHVPFPPVEVYARLPWRREILEGLLGADVVGFQTERAARNFAEAVSVFTDRDVTGETLVDGPRSTHLVTAPISIEVDDFERIASAPGAKERIASLRRRLGDPRRTVLGVDRLDYTKGIDVRLLAFEGLLDRRPELAADTRFIQIAVPSRESIDDYAEMRSRIEAISGRINGAHGGHHEMPVHYIHAALEREELVAYYGAADVMCVTPLADGMNLVAKEYVASRVDGDGVLILSEFAGAARELQDALLVNPYDVEGVVRALHAAFEMPPSDRANRMQSLRKAVHANDVHGWVRQALDVAGTAV